MLSDKTGKDWWSKNIDDWEGYIRSYGEGVGFPSRKWFATHAAKDASVLDVGCGGGIEYESLMREGRSDIKYAGVDYSPDAITEARRLFPAVDFTVSDARDLKEFGDGSFDTVLIRHCLDHIGEWEKAVHAAWRVASKEVVIILWREMFEGDRPHQTTDHGDDCHALVLSRPVFAKWVADVLRPKHLDFTIVEAKDVPKREYRVDTCIVIKKS